MPSMKSHRGGHDLARSIVLMSVVLGSIVFCSRIFAAQPAGAPGPAPPAAGQPGDPAKAGQPPLGGAPAAEPAHVVYDVDEEQKNKRSVILRILRAPNFAGQQDELDAYYKTYALARWSEEKNAASLADRFRKELRSELQTAKSGPIHDHLNTLALNFMSKMAGECHPAARYNAMLVIGELNGKEPRSSDPAVPLPAALPVLVAAVEDAKQMDAVKVAALVGIRRHVKLGGARDADTANAAMAVIGAPRPTGRSADGYAWMRKLAAEVLGDLAAPGDNGEVATALVGMVADAAAPFIARCTAAEALGRLDYASAAGLDASKLAIPLGKLAVDACAAEAKAQAVAVAKAKAESAAPGAPALSYRVQPGWGLGGPPGGQPGVEMPAPIPIVSRRRLRYRVNAASVGLIGEPDKPGGVASLAQGTAHEKLVATVKQHVQAILDLIEANRTKEADEEEKLKEMMEDITAESEKLRALLSNPSP